MQNFKQNIFNTDNPSQYSEQLIIWINNIFNGFLDRINNFITEMTQSIKLKKGDFSWLEEKRVAYFTWLNLKTLPRHIINNDPLIYINLLDSHCTTNRSRIDVIKKYFDSCEASFVQKIEYITFIQRKWELVAELKHPFKEIEQVNNPELIDWTWDYIKRKNGNGKIVYPNTGIQHIKPTTINEKYDAIFACHDFYYASNIYMQKVFCMEYRRSLSQKKFREKEETKTINTQLKIKVKERLDQMQEHYRYSQQQILEMLINEHYNLIKNKIK